MEGPCSSHVQPSGASWSMARYVPERIYLFRSGDAAAGSIRRRSCPWTGPPFLGTRDGIKPLPERVNHVDNTGCREPAASRGAARDHERPREPAQPGEPAGRSSRRREPVRNAHICLTWNASTAMMAMPAEPGSRALFATPTVRHLVTGPNTWMHE